MKHDFSVVALDNREYGLLLGNKMLLLGDRYDGRFDLINGLKVLAADMKGTPLSDVEALSLMGREVKILTMVHMEAQ